MLDGSDTIDITWHAGDLWERDWIRFLVNDFSLNETFDLDYSKPRPGIHVTKYVGEETDRYFEACRKLGGALLLVHVGDEWFTSNYRSYRHFDGVIRNFPTLLAKGPGIRSVPLGYYVGTGTPRAPRPAGERTYVWSFLGEIKASRQSMVNALSSIGPHFINRNRAAPQDGKRSTDTFDEVMSDTVFAPSPMGTVIVETGRVYEALELGCVPIVEKRFLLDYYREILGDHPIPTFMTWRQAAEYVSRMTRDRARLEDEQARMREWWLSKREAIRRDVVSFLLDSSHRKDLESFADRPSNRSRAVYHALRIFDLARHQSLTAPWPMKRVLVQSLGLEAPARPAVLALP
ncbi:exostosin family protein [Amaricoccus solimangrovi]|uniref:Exostosin family protein n=1 Tax=Amaricoccus solimangrovi TaxID=2589815 RepID=A0A501WF29_9RHOB|nr:exostosin family protein [Amaricoccus solimangrovi]TPE48179.1 exostosin family protein [Amaricoccus solimangrovi]